ncbi:MAG: hypothetical protein ABFD60_14820 [Bryobacteraceae bacterium]
MPFPRVAAIRQHFPDRRLQDIPGDVRRELASAGFGAGLKPGARVAIGAGSRGIANIAVIVRAVVDYWKSIGAQPFVFPAMGTHGAATAEGQANVLANFGITAETMGCPIVSSLEVVSLGTTPDGIETYLDRQAYESDGMMFVGRVKRHTDFEGKIESGLFKMMAIGLGKLTGAQRYHVHAYRMGIEAVVRSVGRHVLRSGKILGGLAVIEDEGHNTAKVNAVRAEEMERREEELLAIAKSWVARIPVPALDILIVDEIGKDISGTGMDTKVVNRNPRADYNPWPNAPKVERIIARNMSALGYGNAVGVGMADVVTDRLVSKIDWQSTYVNAFTSGALSAVRVPLHFPTDRECLERMARTVGKLSQEEVTIGRIRNTQELGLMLLTENLLPEVSTNPAIEVLEEPHEMEFDEEGNLLPF